MTEEPKKIDLSSMDVAAEKRAQLKQLFPEVFSEDKVDFEALRRTLGDWVEPGKERFGLNWPGKAECMRVIQEPSHATLTPQRDQSVNFDETENVFIEGDNLEVLKLLQKAYFGKVKMIYIDPPYNTGNEFIYPDKFSEGLETYLSYTGQIDDKGRKFSSNSDTSGRYHSNWLNMMYPRLYLAKNLLREDGVIFISIDENEFHRLKLVCDQIFGNSNYAGEIVWKNSSKNDQDYVSIQHEYLLAYVKNKEENDGQWVERKEGLDEIYAAFAQFRKTHGNDWGAINKEAKTWYKQFSEANPIFSSKHYSWMDERGVYFPDNISGPNFGQYVYDVIHPETGEVCKLPSSGWRFPEKTMKERINGGLIHFGNDHSTVPNNKTYLKNTELQNISSVKHRDGRAASKRLKALFGKKVFDNPKDEEFLFDLFKSLGISSHDIVLDFFAGSGTTGHAVSLLQSREGIEAKYILVQLPEDLAAMQVKAKGSAKATIANAIAYLTNRGRSHSIASLAAERLKLVGNSIRNEQGFLADLGFRAFTLTPSTQRVWDGDPEALSEQLELSTNNIDPEAEEEALLFELLLKSGLELHTKINTLTIEGKTVYSVAEGALLICLDKALTSDLIDALANLDPVQVILLDEGFQNDDELKVNAVQTFKSRRTEKEDKIVFRTV